MSNININLRFIPLVALAILMWCLTKTQFMMWLVISPVYLKVIMPITFIVVALFSVFKVTFDEGEPDED